MSFVDQVSVLILTFNEAPNIGRTLDALKAFPSIVLLDSCSTDSTLEIAARYPNVRIETRPFDNHGAQWNYGLEWCGLTRPWVLALDADYVLPMEMVEELSRLSPRDQVSGYRTNFRYCIDGQPLRGALYPPVVLLFRRNKAHFVQMGHTQRIVVDGEIGDLVSKVLHDDRKPLSRWLASQQRYAELEARHLIETPRHQLRTSDKIRTTGLAAPIIFLYTLIWKRCLLDGGPGWYYALQRTLAEIMIALQLLEQRMRASESNAQQKVSTSSNSGGVYSNITAPSTQSKKTDPE